MSDEYQLRKDIDRIYADLYQIDDNSVNVLTFRDRSKLKYLGNSDEIATIDDLFDYYQLYERGDGGGSVVGIGSFSIDENGHLIVELPNGVSNPYRIDNNGHLIYDTSV